MRLRWSDLQGFAFGDRFVRAKICKGIKLSRPFQTLVGGKGAKAAVDRGFLDLRLAPQGRGGGGRIWHRLHALSSLPRFCVSGALR